MLDDMPAALLTEWHAYFTKAKPFVERQAENNAKHKAATRPKGKKK